MLEFIKKKLYLLYNKVVRLLWDTWCVASVVGIWPRFIEPRMLLTSRLSLPIDGLSPSLEDLKVVFFSDLHFSKEASSKFLKKISSRINKLHPDIIIFGGDILRTPIIDDPERLLSFLNSLKARYGCFFVFGNHDYSEWVSLNDKGEYDIETGGTPAIIEGFKRFFGNKKPLGIITDRARAVPSHEELSALLKKTRFTVLENDTSLVPIRNTFLNICGLEEYWLGRCNPKKAFKNYDKKYPGIVVTHNPDSFPLLYDYPGDLVLSGHTHGGQINLPWMWKKFSLLENSEFKRGMVGRDGKAIYITRGVGSSEPFRWFSPPEIVLITLNGTSHD
ncbi:MAG: UDP-2,3-diacylglucosamine diphosphatase LpxG [Waddliaceae bacterium]|jgi:uncharacterized protein|nr:UDP-2,3-diacylglucosamine diphosphatase LpxG [Waddliaceae bacterium]MBT3579664.1 UDP-2,3-diacylglucosamine diphosphatase LpxG [Waddliaceae bacterium]MBT4445249.1 UDP-2,3-diacylglucosamine diphosphatase LpxG [Waddliaceae bacterium]MBT6928091.1 UDP-2,3-diacylglucosamine diphosphatase LpxG [Waddliaceae bacterium]MBT7264652.1 UDP-2,3-diacylglucosamine diphosphatase LpxG [Waddliaceae bacterium]